jgi:hypothetical protein
VTKARGRLGHEKGIREIGPALEIDAEDDPSAEPTEEFVYFSELSTSDRLVERLVVGSWGQLVSFAVTQQVHLDGDWKDVVRYDCAHGLVHKDNFRKSRAGSKKEKMTPLKPGSTTLEETHDEVWEALQGSWEENRRRYLNG